MSARCALLLFHFVRFNRRGNLDFHQASSFQSTALRDFEDFQVRSHDGTLFLQSVQIEIAARKNCPPTLCYPLKEFATIHPSRADHDDKITSKNLIGS